MNEFLTNLQRQAEEQPIVALGVAAGLITAISKLIEASGNHRDSIAWKKEVNRRVKATAKK